MTKGKMIWQEARRTLDRIRALVGGTCLLLCPLVTATEGASSNYLPGFYGDFAMARLPDKGLYLLNFLSWTHQNDANTGAEVVQELPGIVYASGEKFLSANFIMAAFPTGMYKAIQDKTAAAGAGRGFQRGGMGDPYLVPAALNWDFGELSLFVFEGIVAPIGYYHKDATVNLGLNIWTFDNMAMATYRPKDSQQELNVAFGYMVNTENPATHYRNGDELHIDYFYGHYFTDTLGIGLAGSYYRQMTSDTLAGQTALGVATGAVSSIGPAITWTQKIIEKDVSFSLKWLHEYDVSFRTPVDYVMLRTIVEL